MTPTIIGDCTLYLGDSLEVLPTLADSVHAVVTDPPYGVNLKGKRTKRAASLVNTGYVGIEDEPEIVERVAVPVVSLCIERFSRVIVMPGTRNMWKYPEPREVGCMFNPSGAGLGRWGFICFQPILYYGKCPYLANGMGARPNGFKDIAAGEKVDGHPCAKPLRWMEWLVTKASPFAGETILDPFMGSGTTALACIKMGRKFVGIEREPSYFKLACERIRKAYAETPLLQESA